jgi:hypothetical protein
MWNNEARGANHIAAGRSGENRHEGEPRTIPMLILLVCLFLLAYAFDERYAWTVFWAALVVWALNRA